jgi:hypothetical protein
VRQHQAHDDTGPQMHGAIVYPDLPAQWITPCLSSPEITAILFGAVQVAPGLIHECRRLTARYPRSRLPQFIFRRSVAVGEAT